MSPGRTTRPASTTDESQSEVTLPLFPLRTVLFPGGLLPLRIFESRYVDMIGRCMREGGEFGVLWIREGGESGAVTRLADTGCSARIVDFERLPDGLLGILARGDRRFDVLSRSTQSDGLHVGQVRWRPERGHTPLADARRPLGNVLRKVIDEYGALARHLQPDFSDAGWVANRFAELLPLSRADRQRLLEMDDPTARIEAIAPMIEVR
jgi:hypothetical protein